MNTLEKLRLEGCSDEEAEVIEQALIDSEAELRHCSGDCSECLHGKFNTCFN